MAEETSPRSKTSGFMNRTVYLAVALLLLAAGGGICAYLIWTKPGPSGEEPQDRRPLVRVFPAARTSHRVAITAYGTSRASKDWTAITEVFDEAVVVSPLFEEGEILPRFEPDKTPQVKTLLIQIDPEQYELAVSRHSAEVRAQDGQIKELSETEVNLKRVRSLQASQLELAQKEVARQEQLLAGNAGSDRAVEAAQDLALARFTALQQTDNKLALIPTQSARALASLDAFAAQLKQAQRELRHCTIRLPYAARCLKKSVEQGQYVTPGERLGTFLALDTAEVVAMVETRKMPHLIPEKIKQLGPIDLGQWHENPKGLPLDPSKSPFELLEIPVRISRALGDAWSGAEQSRIWWGRVTRIASSLDSATQTIPVIIEVRDAYKFQPGVRPPLMPDVFCEVTLYGTTLENVVVIPRDCLHDLPREDRVDRRENRHTVYLLRDGKLHVREVTVAALEEDRAVIAEGIEDGDLVIMGDLFPASEDMPLRGRLTHVELVGARQSVDVPADLLERRVPQDEPAAETPAGAEPSATEAAP